MPANTIVGKCCIQSWQSWIVCPVLARMDGRRSRVKSRRRLQEKRPHRQLLPILGNCTERLPINPLTISILRTASAMMDSEQCIKPHCRTCNSSPSINYAKGCRKRNDSSCKKIYLLEKAKHRNIMLMFGYYSFGDEKFLMYDYMMNGSLDLWLQNRADAILVFDWPKRFRISMGSAHGLCFLHHNFIPHIIDRGIKVSNILLDAFLGWLILGWRS